MLGDKRGYLYLWDLRAVLSKRCSPSQAAVEECSCCVEADSTCALADSWEAPALPCSLTDTLVSSSNNAAPSFLPSPPLPPLPSSPSIPTQAPPLSPVLSTLLLLAGWCVDKLMAPLQCSLLCRQLLSSCCSKGSFRMVSATGRGRGGRGGGGMV